MKLSSVLLITFLFFGVSPAFADDINCGDLYGGVAACYSKCRNGPPPKAIIKTDWQKAWEAAGMGGWVTGNIEWPDDCGACDGLDREVKRYCPSPTVGRYKRINSNALQSLRSKLTALKSNTSGHTRQIQHLPAVDQKSKSRPMGSGGCDVCDNGRSERRPSLSNLQKLESRPDSISKVKSPSGSGKEGITFQRDLNAPISKPK